LRKSANTILAAPVADRLAEPAPISNYFHAAKAPPPNIARGPVSLPIPYTPASKINAGLLAAA